VSARSAVLGCRGRCRGRVVCWCTARRRASRRRIGGGVVGRRGPRGRSVIAEMVQGPHRERRTRARALGTLTTWGDGEWVVVGRGLPGIAVAALRSPTSRCGVHLRRSAGWSLRIVRGQVWGAASEAIRGRGERLESGARCWNSRLFDGSGCTPGAAWGGGHVVAVGCSSPHLAVPLCAAGTPPWGARYPIRRRIENPGLAAAPPMGHRG